MSKQIFNWIGYEVTTAFTLFEGVYENDTIKYLTSSSGTIKSPDYIVNGLYDMTYVIRAPNVTKITLTVDDFELEDSPGCKNEWLQVVTKLIF